MPALYLSHGAPPVFNDAHSDGSVVRLVAISAEANGDLDRERPLGGGPARPLVTSHRNPAGL